ncbi:MAG TPA: DUF4350 domain-containing protein [Planctomycetaceae bacterium]|jgi:hypothetical protein|nr:DUF4350 domain-containing protein [Planctomycetaceae bacterium]
MLTTRNVLTVVILVLLISLVSACISLLGSPTGGVSGRDSYGTHLYGFRGLFETLDALGVPVERELVPPDGLFNRDITLAIFEPDPVIVTTEPAYLHAAAKWVENGGSVVVAPAVSKPGRMTWPLQEWPPRSPLDELSLTQLDCEPFEPRAEQDAEEAANEADGEKTPQKKSKKPRKNVRSSTDEALDFAVGKAADMPVSIVHATVDGEFAVRFPQGLQLAVPAKAPRVITELDKIPGSHVRAVLESDGRPQILAAIYPRGRGTIAVLSDARLAQNTLLGRDDNAVLVAHLLADPGRPVVFDEFYHGRTVRSNPLWLATRFPYNVLALSVLGTTLLVGWRAARVLGPPLPRRVRSRRTLAEYIDAMSRLLNRSKRPVPYLLGELRHGLLWRIRRELGLPPGREDVNKLLPVLARRDPLLADNLRQALEAIDQLLQSPSPRSADVTATLAKVSLCASVPRRTV